MPQKKKPTRKRTAKKVITEKQGIKLAKVSTLSKAELAKLNFDELWIMKPTTGLRKVRARYCSCRNVCLV